MALHFEKYAQEGNIFIKNLANRLGHPEEHSQTGIILRAVLHTLRDRITIAESLNLISQLPMFLKAIYVDSWKYRERPMTYSKIEDFKAQVKKLQEQYGEQGFDWEKPTEDIIKIVFEQLKTYVSQGEIEDILAQLPKEIEELVK
jgi:uncharacterized protein (DUF2267 family)